MKIKLSLLAGAVLWTGLSLALYLGSGIGDTHPAEATQGGSYTAHFSIGTCTGPCVAPLNTTVTLAVNLDTWTTAYDGIDFIVNSSIGAPKSANCSAWTSAPGHIDFSSALSATQAEVACSRGVSDSASVQKGKIGEIVFNCSHSGTLSLDQASFMSNHDTGGSDAITIASLDVTCSAPTSTPTGPSGSPTSTQRPTATPTASGTPGGPKLPAGVAKCLEPAGSTCTTTITKFLTSSARADVCGKTNLSDVQILWERLTSLTPPGVAAFELEIRYDAKLVCVGVIAQPPAQGSNPYICYVRDEIHDPSGPTGIARIGCVTVGKGTHWDTSSPIAIVGVALQPDMVKLLRPGQDNGIVVNILDQDCHLADEQGKPISGSGLYCGDAELTFRYLEGDIVTDCLVDVLDIQDIAFRWGATQQSLLYSRSRDLVPAGGDGVIDVQDLQFVSGRFGSTCDEPWPPLPS